MPSEIPLEKINFFVFNELPIVDSFWIRDLACVHVPSQHQEPHLAWTCASPCVLPQFLRVPMCVSPIVPRAWIFGVFYPNQFLQSLPPVLQSSLNPEGRDLMLTSHLGLSFLRSLTLCTLSSLGLCMCSHLLLGGNFPDDG